MDEGTIPQTDQEYLLCWNLFTASPEHITKGELRQQMSEALREYRASRNQRTLEGWRTS